MTRTLLVSLLLCGLSSGAALADSWSTNATDHASDRDRTFSYSCPPNGNLGASIYGSDIYTTDSAVCVAAVHAGLITPRDGGQVTIRILPGEASYDGTQRNGVGSNRWSSYPASYAFEGGLAAADATWSTTAQELRGQIGRTASFRCPANGATSAVIYGTRTYTSDSAICVAAVHAGKITAAAGGTVTIEMKKGFGAYKSTTANGVSSRPWGSWDSSFEIR